MQTGLDVGARPGRAHPFLHFHHKQLFWIFDFLGISKNPSSCDPSLPSRLVWQTLVCHVSIVCPRAIAGGKAHTSAPIVSRGFGVCVLDDFGRTPLTKLHTSRARECLAMTFCQPRHGVTHKIGAQAERLSSWARRQSCLILSVRALMWSHQLRCCFVPELAHRASHDPRISTLGLKSIPAAPDQP